jgi:hypothetical protein
MSTVRIAANTTVERAPEIVQAPPSPPPRQLVALPPELTQEFRFFFASGKHTHYETRAIDGCAFSSLPVYTQNGLEKCLVSKVEYNGSYGFDRDVLSCIQLSTSEGVLPSLNGQKDFALRSINTDMQLVSELTEKQTSVIQLYSSYCFDIKKIEEACFVEVNAYFGVPEAIFNDVITECFQSDDVAYRKFETCVIDDEVVRMCTEDEWRKMKDFIIKNRLARVPLMNLTQIQLGLNCQEGKSPFSNSVAAVLLRITFRCF